MKRFLFVFLIALVPLLGSTQNYSISSIPYNPDPFNGTPTLINVDDIYSPVIPLPFAFCFYDSSFTDLVISTNGYLTFDVSVANAYSPWPINNAAPNLPGMPDYLIMAPWQDIDPSVTGTISTSVAGVAPYRRFIVSFFEASMFSCNSMLFTQQIILYETTNIIETHIANKPICSTWNSGAAIHGLQKDSSTTHIVPGRNFPTQWSATLEGKRFTPNGSCSGPSSANVVEGMVYLDYNNNCIFDGADAPVANRPVLVDAGAYYDWTDNSGMYSIDLDTGTWNVNQTPPTYFATACAPTSGYNIFFPNQAMSSLNNDFADSVLVYCPDLMVDLGVFNMTTCQTEVGGITVVNQGTVTDSNATVTLTLIDSVQLDSAGYPYTQTGPNTYAFSLGVMNPGAVFAFPIYLEIGCDSVGTVYCISADVAGSAANDCDTTNNTAQDCHQLIGSYDPNDKQVASQDFTLNGWVTEEDITATDQLSYMIRFQNTGSDTAFHVRITDTLSGFLDPATFQAGASNHFYNVVVIGDVVVFEFPDIDLPDSLTNPLGSQGFVRYTVKQRPGNVLGTVIENFAAIYFDFNPPIVTNTTVNTIPTVTGLASEFLDEVKVYPNPGSDRIRVRWEGESGFTFVMRNLMGQEILQVRSDNPQAEIGTDGIAKGTYLYEVRSGDRVIGAGLWIRE